jgi:transcriptional regulator with XRE-family HTH domain
MELGKKIRQLRFKAELTQEQLAEKVGVGAQAVSKWETSAAMPDITLLPVIAETFGVTIDDLFDLSAGQRLNRIENRMDLEDELPQDVFWEYEDYLRQQLESGQDRKRILNLTAYLYWHRSNSYGLKASRFAKEAVRMDPEKKESQWVLSKTDGHAVWDWNISNHKSAVEFYRGIVEENPEAVLPCLYLLDNLIADRRADDAEKYLGHLRGLKNADPMMCEVYRAHIALARFNEPEADSIIEKLLSENPDSFVCLFEAAQYYAGKCDYDKAIACYEQSFEKEPRRPRFQDELMGIRDIYEIMGDYGKAAETQQRILDLLEKEWGLEEGSDLQHARDELARLSKKAES